MSISHEEIHLPIEIAVLLKAALTRYDPPEPLRDHSSALILHESAIASPDTSDMGSPSEWSYGRAEIINLLTWVAKGLKDLKLETLGTPGYEEAGRELMALAGQVFLDEYRGLVDAVESGDPAVIGMANFRIVTGEAYRYNNFVDLMNRLGRQLRGIDGSDQTEVQAMREAADSALLTVGETHPGILRAVGDTRKVIDDAYQTASAAFKDAVAAIIQAAPTFTEFHIDENYSKGRHRERDFQTLKAQTEILRPFFEEHLDGSEPSPDQVRRTLATGAEALTLLITAEPIAEPLIRATVAALQKDWSPAASPGGRGPFGNRPTSRHRWVDEIVPGGAPQLEALFPEGRPVTAEAYLRGALLVLNVIDAATLDDVSAEVVPRYMTGRRGALRLDENQLGEFAPYAEETFTAIAATAIAASTPAEPTARWFAGPWR